MRRRALRLPLWIAAIPVLTCCAGSAAGQCGPHTLAFNYVAPVLGNPFQAERVSIRTGFNSSSDDEKQPLTELIARDGQGRVRIERAGVTYKIKMGTEADREGKTRTIVICDPTAQAVTQLDTFNKTATVFREEKEHTLASPRPRFCDSFKGVGPANLTVEDLGHRVFEGVDAEGLRLTSQRPSLIVREQWCSKELEIMVVSISTYAKTGAKEEATLTKLERREPDPTLFKIPPDYTVSERVLAESSPPAPPKLP
jgi:hypothetical protein